MIARHVDLSWSYRSFQLCFIRVSMRYHVSRCTRIFPNFYQMYDDQLSAFPLWRMDTSDLHVVHRPLEGSPLEQQWAFLSLPETFLLPLLRFPPPGSFHQRFASCAPTHSVDSARGTRTVSSVTSRSVHWQLSKCVRESAKSVSRFSTRDRRFHPPSFSDYRRNTRYSNEEWQRMCDWFRHRSPSVR